MEDLRLMTGYPLGLNDRILDLENSGGTKAEIIDALKVLDRDEQDVGNLDHLLDKTKKKIRKEVKEKSILIYKSIRRIDKAEGDLYLKHMD